MMSLQKKYNKIIINADDFGYKSSINKAIVESFNKGLINSTTIMANMPYFDEAVELGYKHNFIDRIGIHLNLDEGNFLTSDIRSADLFEKRDHKRLKNKRSLFFLSRNEKISVYKEFAAQIEKVQKAGIPISHVDTHHHIHETYTVAQIILALLKSYNVPSMRILNNLKKPTVFYKSGYRKLVNIYIKINHVNYSDYFGNQLEVISLVRNYPFVLNDKKIETMVHPDYNQMGKLIDRIKTDEYNFEYPDDFSKFISTNWNS
jgi:chitin disaccharide deacetylase